MTKRMYPERVSWEEGHGTERRVYEACREQLDDSYSVFYSVPRMTIDDKKRPRDGEADFVIAHPDKGIFVLEVKGGAVAFADGYWTSTNRFNVVHDIKDPFQQGVDAAHNLEKELAKRLRPAGRYLRVGHAAIFPDGVPPGALSGLNKPAPIVLDAGDLNDMAGAVERVLGFYRGTQGQRDFVPGADGVVALKDMLYKPWQLQPVLWSGMRDEQKRMIELTQQQLMVLDMLAHLPRAAIAGCAGSGKTLLAAEKAVRMARAKGRVLLTCFNKNLAAYLREHLGATIKAEGLRLDIVHFNELCDKWAQRAGVELKATGEPGSDFFEKQQPQALMEAIDRLPDRYDAVIVDEGQDFLDEWWIPLEMLLQDPAQGTLWIFYDDNQRIFVEHNEFPVPANQHYPLTVNCRNTQRIHSFVSRFYQGERPAIALGPDGKSVELRRFAAGETLQVTLGEVLGRLTSGKDGVPAEQIVVLTPFSRGKSKLWEAPLPGKLQLAEGAPANSSQVHCTTIQSFKGLERPVIILAELERWPIKYRKLEALLYVGASRASNHLVIVMPKDAPEEIAALVAPGAS